MAPFIELEHIFDALKGFTRPVREGRETVKNIVYIGISDKKTNVVTIQALCIRTTKSDPVTIQVIIDKKSKNIEDKIKAISCTCPSGASKEHCCKHSMAVLIYLEKYEDFSASLIAY